MAIWGTGLLQNDCAWEGIEEVTGAIREDLWNWAGRRPTEPVAGKVAAAVGLFLQFSRSSFDPQNEFAKTLKDIVRQFEPVFAQLTSKAKKLLRAILANQGLDMASRRAPLTRELQQILYGELEVDLLSMEIAGPDRFFGKREPPLFEHDESSHYVQVFADRCVKRIDRDFQDKDILMDLARDARGIGPLVSLLFLEPCQVDEDLFPRWRKRAFKVYELFKPSLDKYPNEQHFLEQYYGHLDLCFSALSKKYGSSPMLPSGRGKRS